MISIVVPMKDEEENVIPLYRRVKETMGSMDWEIIMVDDGSGDGTFERIRELCAMDSRVIGIRHARNYGQTAGISTGFAHARGDIIITMDGDLQNPPELIPELLKKMEEGFDVVNASRKERKKQSAGRWLPSLISNRLASFLSGLEISDFGSGMKAIRRTCLEGIELYGDFHRYYLILLAEKGCRIGEITYEYVPRHAGSTKYGLKRLIKGPIDLIYLTVLRRHSCFRWAERFMRKHYYHPERKREIAEVLNR